MVCKLLDWLVVHAQLNGISAGAGGPVVNTLGLEPKSLAFETRRSDGPSRAFHPLGVDKSDRGVVTWARVEMTHILKQSRKRRALHYPRRNRLRE